MNLLRSRTALWKGIHSCSCVMVSFGDVTELGGWDVVVFVFVVYIVFVVFLKKPMKSIRPNGEEETSNALPPMRKRDFTVKELLLFNGVQNERILMAICGKVTSFSHLNLKFFSRSLLSCNRFFMSNSIEWFIFFCFTKCHYYFLNVLSMLVQDLFCSMTKSQDEVELVEKGLNHQKNLLRYLKLKVLIY